MDPAFQPDPKLVALAAAEAARFPKRPLPAKADVSKSFSRWRTEVDVWRQVFVEGFKAHGQADAANAAAAEKFLDGYCLRIGGSPQAPAADELLTAGQALAPLHTSDPHVALALGGVLSDSALRQSPTFVELLSGLNQIAEQNRLSPWLAARYHRLSASSGGGAARNTNAPLSDEQRRHLRQAAESLVRAASDSSLTNPQRQTLISLMTNWSKQYPADAFRDVLIAELQEAQEVDPWVRGVHLARHYVEVGWLARGNGTVDTVTLDRWQRFYAELDKARFYALRAWEAHRELPEATTTMIGITMANRGVEGVGERFWFDEAVAADFIHLEAYSRYLWALRPRWGGSHQQMFDLGRECLDSGRFDTEVPFQYYRAIHGIAEERQSWRSLLTDPAIYEGSVRLFSGYEQAANDEAGRRRQRSRLAAVAWWASKRGQARKILADLGTAADPSSFGMFRLSLPGVRDDLETNMESSRPPAFAGQPGIATAVAVLPDGQHLLQGNDEGEIAVWDIASRQRIRLLKEHATAITGCAVAQQGSRAYTAGSDGKVRVWDTSQWRVAGTIDIAPPLYAIALSADGTRLVVSRGTGEEAQVVICDTGTQQPVETISLPGGPVFSLAFDPLKRRLFYLRQPQRAEENLLELDLQSRQSQAIDSQFSGEITAWSLSPDGQRVAAGVSRMTAIFRQWKQTYQLTLLDAGTGAVLTELQHVPEEVLSVAFSKDGDRIYATTRDGSLLTWKPGGSNPSSCTRYGIDALSMLTASADGSQAAAVDSDGLIHVLPLFPETAGLKIETTALQARFRDSIHRLENTPDGKSLVVVVSLGELSVWDWEQGLRTCQQAFNVRNLSYWAALFPDKERVLADQVFDLTTGDVVNSLPATGPRAVSPTGAYIAIAGSKGVQVYSGSDYRPLPWGTIPGHSIQLVAFSPDGNALLTSAQNGNMRWYDLPEDPQPNTPPLQFRPTFVVVRAAPTRILVSSDNSLVACCNTAADVIDAQNGRGLWTTPGKCISFSADGQRIIVGGGADAPQAAAVHEARTGRKLLTLQGGHQSEITAVAISPDGRIALTGDQEGILRAWDAATGELLRELPAAGQK